MGDLEGAPRQYSPEELWRILEFGSVITCTGFREDMKYVVVGMGCQRISFVWDYTRRST